MACIALMVAGIALLPFLQTGLEPKLKAGSIHKYRISEISQKRSFSAGLLISKSTPVGNFAF